MSKEHEIFFYKDKNGKEPVREFIEELSKKNTKDRKRKKPQRKRY